MTKPLEKVLIAVRHVPEVSCEEFVEGEEFTFDGVAIDGNRFISTLRVFPRPLVARTREDISPVICTIRNPDACFAPRDRAGPWEPLKHLVWVPDFSTWSGTAKRMAKLSLVRLVVAGGAHLVDQMNYTSDIDLFREWARAVC